MGLPRTGRPYHSDWHPLRTRPLLRVMVTIKNKGQRVLTFIFLLYSEPVGINPTAISFCAWLDGYESYLGAYPLAFFHGEGFTYGFEMSSWMAG